MNESSAGPSRTMTSQQWLTYLNGSWPAVGQLLARVLEHPTLGALGVDLARLYTAIATALEQGGTLYLCGNGGSFCDAVHISAELLKSFVRPRPLPESLGLRLREQPHGEELATHLQAGLRAHVLGLNTALASAAANDIPVAGIGYAQELVALAREGDVLLGISTSGRARNVLLAVEVGKALGLSTLGLTGQREGNPLAALAEISLCVPERETYRVQEAHLALYHQLCLMLEARFFAS